MSGVVSGITKVFSAVGSATARVGQAVSGVGASVFTAGAASGAGSMASGGLTGVVQSVAGKGVLGSVLSGALKTALPGMVIGGVVGAVTGQGFMKGALMGGLGGAVMGGVNAYGSMSPNAGVDAMTTGSIAPSASRGLNQNVMAGHPSGGEALRMPVVDAATGQTVASGTSGSAIPAQTAAGQLANPGNGGLLGFLQSENAAGIMSGLGQGMIEKAKVDAIAAENQKNRDYKNADQKRITDSYDIAPGSLNRGRFSYDPSQGRVVRG